MVSTDTPLSNSRILKVPPDGNKQLVRPLGPNKQTHWTISLVVSPTPLQCPEEDVQKMCEEGGVNLVRFLMGKALTTQDPQVENVCNWSYKDITCLPQAEQKLWQLAYQEELNMLHKHKVFELIDHPQDQKVIKNQWVFDIKSDGCKKAHLVLPGLLSSCAL